MALTVLAVQSALALSFDPRYRDFPFAPLTAAALPFLLLSSSRRGRPARARCWRKRSRPRCWRLCAVFIVWNETLANWQALWFAAAARAAGVQLASGTGRARLRISSATASADSAVL